MAVKTENIPTANVNSFCHLAKANRKNAGLLGQNNTKKFHNMCPVTFFFWLFDSRLIIVCIAMASNFQDSSVVYGMSIKGVTPLGHPISFQNTPI